nr:MAG TPA: hypothetical protein [Caudoviricetes sp.]
MLDYFLFVYLFFEGRLIVRCNESFLILVYKNILYNISPKGEVKQWIFIVFILRFWILALIQ